MSWVQPLLRALSRRPRCRRRRQEMRPGRRQPRSEESHRRRLPRARTGVALTAVARRSRASRKRAGPPRPKTRGRLLALAAGAAPGHGALIEAAGVVVWKDTVGPSRARVLGYTVVRVGPDTVACAAPTRLTPGLRADTELAQPDIDLSVAALLAERHRAHPLVRPVM